MAKAAVDAQKIKELEQENAELRITLDAQSAELVSQMNQILALRRDVLVLRAASNGATAPANAAGDPAGG